MADRTLSRKLPTTSQKPFQRPKVKGYKGAQPPYNQLDQAFESANPKSKANSITPSIETIKAHLNELINKQLEKDLLASSRKPLTSSVDFDSLVQSVEKEPFDELSIESELSSENKPINDLSVGNGENKPRPQSEIPVKCPYSPYLYHRFVKQERQNHENGSKSTILRCRYCALLVQVWVSYREDKNGRMIAYRETNIVENQAL